jgi:hypothetical protein
VGSASFSASTDWTFEPPGALVSLLQVLQNVNSATHAADSSCLLKPDLLSCRAVQPSVKGIVDGLGVDGDGAHAAHEHILLSEIATRTALLAGLIATL